MISWMLIGCLGECGYWLFVSSSLGLRKNTPLPIGLRALRHARGPAGLLPTNDQHTHIHPTLHPIIHPTIRPHTHSYIYSPTHSFTHPSVSPPIHPHSSILAIHPYTHSFSQPSIHQTVRPPTCVRIPCI